MSQPVLLPGPAAPDERAIRRIKRASERSLFYFAKFILGMKDLNEHHKALCDWKQGKSRTGVLWPRGTFKTSLELAELLWAVCRNPEERCLVASGTDVDAKKRIRFLRVMMETNAVLRGLWPDVFYTNPEESPSWSDEGLTVKRSGVYVDPTFFPGSVESNVVGQHATRALLDDLVNMENSRSEIGRRSVLDYWQMLRPVMTRQASESGEFIERIAGTRFDDGDAYGWIMENDDGILWNVRGIWEHEEGGRTIMGDLLDARDLEAIRKSMGASKFASQYLNDPISDETAVFKAEDLERSFYEEPPSELTVTVTMDPAKKLGKEHDNTAITVRGLARSGHWYCLDSIAGHLSLTERMRKLHQVCSDQDQRGPRVQAVGIEDADGIELPAWNAYMRECGSFWATHEIKHRGRTKKSRIESLAPWIEGGRFHLRRAMKADEDELVRFPKGRRDDRADSWAMHLDLPVGTPGSGYDSRPYMQVNAIADRIKGGTPRGRDPVGVGLADTSHGPVEVSWMV